MTCGAGRADDAWGSIGRRLGRGSRALVGDGVRLVALVCHLPPASLPLIGGRPVVGRGLVGWSSYRIQSNATLSREPPFAKIKLPAFSFRPEKTKAGTFILAKIVSLDGVAFG